VLSHIPKAEIKSRYVLFLNKVNKEEKKVTFKYGQKIVKNKYWWFLVFCVCFNAALPIFLIAKGMILCGI